MECDEISWAHQPNRPRVRAMAAGDEQAKGKRTSFLPRLFSFIEARSPADSSPMKTAFSEMKLDELERRKAHRSVDARSRRHMRLLALQQRVSERVRRMQGRYQLHERLLFLWYSRRADVALQRGGWLTDPLARWRMWWRSLGVLMLLVHTACLGASSWVAYRCDADPLCDLHDRHCPDVCATHMTRHTHTHTECQSLPPPPPSLAHTG